MRSFLCLPLLTIATAVPLQVCAQDELLLDDLPTDVLATMEARDRFFASGAIEGTGDKFIVSDLQAWPPGATVTVAFMGGNNDLHADITEATQQITDNSGLSFDFGYDPDTDTYRTWSTSDTDYQADIRVSFDQSGYYSLIGRDSITPFIGRPNGPNGGRPHQRSLNLGGFHIQRPANWRRIVRHEFLHAVAFKHEHQSPLGGCDAQFRWEDDPGYIQTRNAAGVYVSDTEGRRPGIYTYLSGAPNFWSRAKVDHNLRQLPAGSGTAGDFDRESIMLYRFKDLFYVSSSSPCLPIGNGENLSEGDIAGLHHLYPLELVDSKELQDRQIAASEAMQKSLRGADDAAAQPESVGTEDHGVEHRSQVEQFFPATMMRATEPSVTEESDAQEPSTSELIQDQLRAHRAKLYYEEGSLVDRTAGPKIVYGNDDRIDILRLESQSLERRLAASTCLLTSRSRILSEGDRMRIHLQDYQFNRLPPCGNERFAAQKTGGWCSGFLVRPDIVCTAGHCCQPTDADVQQIAFVFGFYARDDSSEGDPSGDPSITPSDLQPHQVYFGKRVVAHQLDSGGDYAIIQLDRAVTFPGAAPLPITQETPVENQNIGMIGHPSGLPSKAAFGDETVIADVGTTWLKTNLDAYGGNSGSAVFNTSGDIVGILVRGNQDFRVHNNRCFFTNMVQDSQAGEMLTRASIFQDEIPAPIPDPRPDDDTK